MITFNQMIFPNLQQKKQLTVFPSVLKKPFCHHKIQPLRLTIWEYIGVVSNFTEKCNNAEINFIKIISFVSSSDSTLQHVCTLEAFCISQSFATFALSHNSHGFGNPACDCHHSSSCQDCLRGSFLGGNLLSCGHHCSGFEINFVLTFFLQPWRNLYLAWMFLSGCHLKAGPQYVGRLDFCLK